MCSILSGSPARNDVSSSRCFENMPDDANQDLDRRRDLPALELGVADEGVAELAGKGSRAPHRHAGGGPGIHLPRGCVMDSSVMVPVVVFLTRELVDLPELFSNQNKCRPMLGLVPTQGDIFARSR